MRHPERRSAFEGGENAIRTVSGWVETLSLKRPEKTWERGEPRTKLMCTCASDVAARMTLRMRCVTKVT